MNKARRIVLQQTIESLQAMRADIEEIQEQEQESYDNLPESLQNGDKGQAMSEAIDNMEQAKSSIDDAVSALEDSKGE